MTTPRRSPWKLPAPWTAKNAAPRALENAGAFSTSFHRRSCQRTLTRPDQRACAPASV